MCRYPTRTSKPQPAKDDSWSKSKTRALYPPLEPETEFVTGMHLLDINSAKSILSAKLQWLLEDPELALIS